MLDNTYIDLERSGSREDCGLIVEFPDSLSILFAINSCHTFVIMVPAIGDTILCVFLDVLRW